ncbi:MAG: bacterial transcriptional activator domain-containing protein [Caldilineaceae bacterium]
MTPRGDRDFKVALNALHKAIEPERAPRADPYFLRRHELTYGLYFEPSNRRRRVRTGRRRGNRALETDDARHRPLPAAGSHHGDYLPARRYEDWSSAERERLQVLALNAMTSLAHLLLTRVPQESIRLTERALSVDPIWEDAYRIQMRAYAARTPAHGAAGLSALRGDLGAGVGHSPLRQTTELYTAIREGTPVT